MKLEQINKKKLSIIKDELSINIKIKHIPVFLMMLQKHYGPFSQNEGFGKHQVLKYESDTIVTKKKDTNAKYSISNFAEGTRVYGIQNDSYIIINEHEVSQLISLLSNLYLDQINFKKITDN